MPAIIGDTPRAIVRPLLVLILGLALPLSGQSSKGGDPNALVESILHQHPGCSAGVWIADDSGELVYAREADRMRPTASAIKSAIAIEFFAAHAGKLEDPLPGAAEVLKDDEHPAIRHFNAKLRARIREQLIPASVRRIGEMMISGRGVSNPVYNAATNLAMASLGGPEATTKKIHARHPDFRELVLRRYMLARRDRGDNEASARALGRVLLLLADRKLPGVDEATTEAVRLLLLKNARPEVPGFHFRKSGALDSLPPCRIYSDWWEHEHGRFVCVVMVDGIGTIVSKDEEDAKREVLNARLSAAREELTLQLSAWAKRRIDAENARHLHLRTCIDFTKAGAPILRRRHPDHRGRYQFSALAVLAPRPGEVIADIGCGNGDLALPIAYRIGSRGRLLARDLNDKAVKNFRARITPDLRKRIEAKVSLRHDIGIAKEHLDAAFLSRAYQPLFPNDPRARAKKAFLRSIFYSLKPGGRLVITGTCRNPAAGEERAAAIARDVANVGFEAGRSWIIHDQGGSTDTLAQLFFRMAQ